MHGIKLYEMRAQLFTVSSQANTAAAAIERTCNDELSEDVVQVVVGGPVRSRATIAAVHSLKRNAIANQQLARLQVEASGDGISAWGDTSQQQPVKTTSDLLAVS